MKVALVSMNVKQGKCEENFLYMKGKIEQAIKDEADIIVFPQNAISGYLLGDRWLEDAWCQYVDGFNDKLIALSHQIAIVWGNIKYRNHRKFNAAFFAYEGKTHMRVKKHDRKGIAQDVRYFEENAIQGVIEYKGVVFALNFQNEIQLADMNINLDAKYYTMEDTKDIHGNVIYVNACGVQNIAKSVVIMQGGSLVITQKKTRYQAPYFQEDYAVIDLHMKTEVTKKQPSLLEAMAYGIREFDQQVFGGNIPWVIGLSGGLDSSVNCALLAYALGSERVYAFNMATKHNRSTTIQNAYQEAKALRVHYKEGVITDFVDVSAHTLMDVYGFQTNKDETLVMENIQARARGYLLSGFAGILGGVIANNGNKVESMLGYCTLYGDSVGALSMIGDLTKVQLFALSKEINHVYGKEVIPENLLPIIKGNVMDWKMPPSAELKANQKDPMKWFYHDYLAEHLGNDLQVCDLMKMYYYHELDKDIMKWIKYYELDKPQAFLEDLDWFIQTMDKNSFKRLQMPPVLCLHNTSLSMQIDAQMQYDKTMYEDWKEKIRNM